MSSKVKFKSDTFEAIHASASALHKVGAMDKATMRSFDETCLSAPPELKPEQIKQLREANRVSQPVFARHLNTSTNTVAKRATGAKHPNSVARKLLAIVRKHGLGWGVGSVQGIRYRVPEICPEYVACLAIQGTTSTRQCYWFSKEPLPERDCW